MSKCGHDEERDADIGGGLQDCDPVSSSGGRSCDAAECGGDRGVYGTDVTYRTDKALAMWGAPIIGPIRPIYPIVWPGRYPGGVSRDYPHRQVM